MRFSDDDVVSLTKSLLEILRNTAIVGTFGYIYSNNTAGYLGFLYYMGCIALVLNVAFQIPAVPLEIDSFKSKFLNRFLTVVSVLFIRTFIGGILPLVLNFAVQDISNIQKRQAQVKPAVQTSTLCRFTLDLTGNRCL